MISIVVPCYNEEENIVPLVKRFRNVREVFPIELILVDNGSTDNTNRIISEAVKKFDWIKQVNILQNKGYGNGILKGLNCAEGEYLGWIHADLQSEPETFVKMIKMARKIKGDFLIKGARTNRSLADNIFTVGMGVFESVLFKRKFFDVNSQPTLLNRKFYDSWTNPPDDFSLDLYVYVLAAKKNISIFRVNSPQHKREKGSSSWNTNWMARIKMVKRVIDYSFATKRRIGR